ncbi:MAG: ABC transporter substrate-binding protein [Planctomycetota bacterium]|jgi:tungstate transport system substrate-binding protein
MRALVSCLFLAAVWGCGESEPAPTSIRLATTTSTHNSGLLDDLLPPFEEREGIAVQVIPVGTGQALALGERGDADVVLVHAREREDAFIEAGHGVERRDIMWNDFVVAGPRADPAGVRGLRDAAEAFRRIRAARARFVSRGDDSGTHIRELAVWKKTGQDPPRGMNHYLEAGQGMGRCLTIAGEKGAYVLTDRGTFLAYRSRLGLEVLVEGDRLLRNPYGAMLINPARHPHVQAEAARKLLDYLTSEEGQRRIGAFRVDGQVLFHPARTKG